MDVPGVDMNIQRGRLGLEETDYEFEVQQDRAEMQLTSHQAQVELQEVESHLEIDKTQMRRDLGLYSHLEMRANSAREAMETAREAIARYAEVGDRLMDFQNNDISDIAFEEMLDDEVEFQLAYLSPPDITFEPGDLEVSSREGRVELDAGRRGELNRPDYQFAAGSLDIYLRQRPEVDVTPPPPGSTLNRRA